MCEQLHLPVQSGSTRVLKAMRRTYSRERYLTLVESIRAAIPDIALTTDIIVGFPGETDADFEQTLSLYDEIGYDHAFTFVFSPRRATEAARMEDQVPEPVKKERIARLVDHVQSTRPGGTVSSRGRCRRCWWRARAGPTRPCCVAGAAATRPSTSTGRPHPESSSRS